VLETMVGMMCVFFKGLYLNGSAPKPIQGFLTLILNQTRSFQYLFQIWNWVLIRVVSEIGAVGVRVVLLNLVWDRHHRNHETSLGPDADTQFYFIC